MTTRYFAYGSNMCSGRLRDYSVAPIGRGRAAVLSGYALRFNKPALRDGSAKANIEEREGEEVWGVVYEISGADIDVLDRGEGGYRRASVALRAETGEKISAETYIALRPLIGDPVRPYTWYMRFLIEGAKEHGLPAAYIARLRSVPADVDADKDRDADRRALGCP